jgi:hypothetical protein
MNDLVFQNMKFYNYQFRSVSVLVFSVVRFGI